MLRHAARSLGRTGATPRAYSTTSRPPLKVAVIGSGPSGFYAASRILAQLPPTSEHGQATTVDMYERLPTPYGLARYGVAPDHPEVKNCQHKFDELATDPRFAFFGNVSVGQHTPGPFASYAYPHALHVPLGDLAAHYNAVVFAYGASHSNPLASVPGSSASATPLAGVVPALALVSWYNGHPGYADLPVDLSKTHTVDVVGQGNVALDVARILLRPIDTLKDTDMPEDVLAVLAASSVRKVRAVGRRGPAQVAFTTKEFREMVNLPDVAYAGVDAGLMAQAQELTKGDRMRTRMLALMAKPANAGGRKTFELDFLLSPAAFLPGEDGRRVAAAKWDVNELAFEGKAASARRTGEQVTRETDMVVESVGYRSEPLGGLLPFDSKRGRVVNAGGRVTAADGTPVPGAYVSGWAGRGPVGVIASTMQDAYGLVEGILGDYVADDGPFVRRDAGAAIPLAPEGGRPDAVEKGLKDGRVVPLAGWHAIDKAEQERAKGTGKEREKFRRVEDMLSVLG
ncbi:NADPH:adrenodoxin oxidoreductase, mitochondrial [Vanrija pseudolonga]|uniref:NADPH:adrenodoxin oxidoreductase, mitochondrial n=1 Tax=Vanrija pseudolonga TaxID=143232 RepID=A0AAF1BML1_9TREE|nr:NADPH:adrenodoxin oxidoreductase, mitochondrial [Vanrija pseudolonga]